MKRHFTGEFSVRVTPLKGCDSPGSIVSMRAVMQVKDILSTVVSCELIYNNKSTVTTLVTSIKTKVKQSRYRPSSGPEGSRKLRLPDFITAAQGGGKVVSLAQRLSPGNSPGTHFS